MARKRRTDLLPAPEAIPVFDLPKTNTKQKLTVEVLQKLYTEIVTGVGKEDACLRAGITRQTLHRWVIEAQQNPDDKALATLIYVLDHAEAQYIAALEKKLLQASVGDAPRAEGMLILKMLERRRPSRWAPTSRGEVPEEAGIQDTGIVVNVLPPRNVTEDM